MLSTRLATAIFTKPFDKSDIVVKNHSQIIIINETLKTIYVRSIHSNIEEYYVF